jgi:hypothetical protein
VIQVAPQMPAPYPAGENVHDHRQINEAIAQANVGDVNGMITNDKFCLSRFLQLQLSWSRIGLYQRRQNKSKSGYPSDETISHTGGTYETRMAYSSSNQSEIGRAATLGSSLSTSVPVEPDKPEVVDPSHLKSNSGGAL